MKKNILIISIYYPPIHSIASNRIFSFAKYLDKEKYNIFILTLNNDKKDIQYEIPGVRVIRIADKAFLGKAGFNETDCWIYHNIKALYNHLYNCIFAEYHYWGKEAINAAKEIVQKHNIDVIISSYSPLISHLVALRVKKEYKDIKWIADMRDEMSKNPYLLIFAKEKIKIYEQKILKYCNAVTSVSRPILDDFQYLSPNNKCIFKEIRNGYDFNIDKNFDIAKNGNFTIVYTGSFYGKRNPDNFFKALEDVIKENKLKVKVKLYGIIKPLNISENLKEIVEILGKIEHENSLLEMKKADALLLVCPTQSQKGAYTGKVFEYLASLRPILALVPKNDVAEKLIKDANAGYIATNENIEGIKTIILEAYNDWKNKKIFNPNIEIIKKHHRKEQVKRLEILIEELLHQ